MLSKKFFAAAISIVVALSCNSPVSLAHHQQADESARADKAATVLPRASAYAPTNANRNCRKTPDATLAGSVHPMGCR